MEGVGMLVEHLERVLDGLAPHTLTEPWDTTGLLVGRRGTEVSRVIVALDLTEDVVVVYPRRSERKCSPGKFQKQQNQSIARRCIFRHES